ncbi:hypothetical protein [Alicyclobacillus mengziensis]|uniref:Uncharacterized protein n=1 Tax=Alicyclobacillus mengziensis TaxID=2931921 RepID=A0A9X7W1M0_9BACL|nr:hypothetical protein [Alicyclobacillus mengziensis]QSO48659.1 hypothetical protein JZ786_06745 [Alicyclobacillus mengziensis]
MMHNRRVVLIVVAVTVILLAVVLFFGGMLFNRSRGGFGTGSMMGGGMMGSGSMMGGSTTSNGPAISNAQLQQLVKQGEVGATINKAANTVTYTGTNVNLVALASPHGVLNMTWRLMDS